LDGEKSNITARFIDTSFISHSKLSQASSYLSA